MSIPFRRSPGQMDYLHAEEASAWIQILRDPSAEQCAAFVAWLKEAPRHVQDFLVLLSLDDALGAVDSQRRIDIDQLLTQIDSAVVALPGHSMPGTAAAPPAPPTESSSSFRRRPSAPVRGISRFFRSASPALRRSMTAGLAVTGLVAWLLLGPQSRAWNDLQTGIGEQRSFELRDGSVIQLNARSHVAYRFSDRYREVRLFDGEAIFRVHHEAARPFRVITPEALVQDVGTQFNVYHRDDGTLIAVVEGRVSVRVEPPGTRSRIAAADNHRSGEPGAAEGAPALSLGANERVRIDPTGVVESHSAGDVTDAVAWQQRRLIFRQETLGRIAQEFNRYNRRQIRLEGTGTPARLYTGVFDADDPDSLVLVLAREPDLVVEPAADGFLVRPRSGAAAAR